MADEVKRKRFSKGIQNKEYTLLSRDDRRTRQAIDNWKKGIILADKIPEDEKDFPFTQQDVPC